MRIALLMPCRGQVRQEERSPRPWLPPGSLLEVAAMTPSEHQVLVWDELAQGPLTPDTLPDADLYGISGLSTSRYGAHRLAGLIRAYKPQSRIVAGGMDVTGCYSEGGESQLLKHYDAVVVGRLTPSLWRTVLADAQSPDGLRPVYRAAPDEPWVFVPTPHHIVNPKRYFLPAAIRSSYGCNEGCAFCTVNLVAGGGRKVYCKPAEVLEKELATLPGSPFADTSDSFGAEYDHTMEVVLPLYKRLGRPWFAEVTAQNLLGVGKPGRSEMITPMAKAHCAGVYMGVESLIGAVSGKSIPTELMEEAVERVHRAGMMALGSAILDVTGEETRETTEHLVHWMIRQKFDFVQYSLLALLPGSRLRGWALAHGKVIDDNPEHLDGAWPTIAHKNLTPKERIELLAWAYKKTYSLGGVLGRFRVHKQLPVWLAASYQVYKSAKRWVSRVGSYDYWLATRQDPGAVAAG